MKKLLLSFCAQPPSHLRHSSLGKWNKHWLFFLQEKKKIWVFWVNIARAHREGFIWCELYWHTNEGLTDKARENVIWAQTQCLLTRPLAFQRVTLTQLRQCEVNLFSLSLGKQMWAWELLLLSDTWGTRLFAASAFIPLEGDVRFLWDSLISHCLG